MIDYDFIIKNISDEKIIKIMTGLGIEWYQETESYILFPTCCHNPLDSEASHKLYYYKDTKIFMCYTECGTMNIFSFLKHFYETNKIDYDWYEDIYMLLVNNPLENFNEDFIIPPYKREHQIIRKKDYQYDFFNPSILDCFIKKYPVEWLQDGITKEAMDKYDIRFSISQNKIIIPHKDKDGNLIGVRGRALDKWEIENSGKYMPIKIENKWYSHKLSFNLYGLFENKDTIKKEGFCFIFESEKAVLQLEKFNIPNCAVAVCGSHFNKYQLNLLLRNCQPKEIIICFDKEELPRENSYFYKLYNLCKKYNLYANFSFIYDIRDLLELKDSPSDKGEEVFLKLLQDRVRVE